LKHAALRRKNKDWGNYFNGVFQNGQNKNLLPVKNEENHLDPGSKKINLGKAKKIYACLLSHVKKI
jgi:hypothetical protein